ncbi:MAG: divergent polysaccharide deacetylase family protein [Gammaproteobacteria bacterium]|nr:divergent polysaccharide deacetylase family protein [Gammaproteobacteria bacterium]
MTRIAFLLAAVLAALSGVAISAEAPRIAIIIDDLGYQLAAGRRAIALPGPVSFAILPGAPRTHLLATSATESGKEVLLHLPMQASIDDDIVEPVTLTLDMSRSDFAETFDAAIAAVPSAVGISNHRGGLITRHPGHMQWLMEEIHARDTLFFIDSYTTHESVALQLAAETGVDAIKRDVFLDTDPAPDTIRREFERLKLLARQRGAAVGIGHPYATTLAFLEAELPKLAEQGFKLVTISELVTN